MDFSDKLTALLTLTATKNADLADALGVARSYISRLKNGARKMPSNQQVIRDMAVYFAQRCEGDYQRTALREFTSDPRLNVYVNETVLREVIWDWLTDSLKKEDNPAGRFLNSFELFSQDIFPTESPIKNSRHPEATGILAYYKNEGKRQAMRDMIAYIDSLNKPCSIWLFTDESYDWLIEDAAFNKWLNTALSLQAERGVKFERIQPPFNNLEFSFSAIERWLPIYMAGAIQQFYYPWLRDQLHRRSIFVVPGHIAMYSSSVQGEKEASITSLTRDSGLVEIYEQQYQLIKKLCQQAISTFTADSERLFSEAEEVVAIEDTGIYKNSTLSVNTLPTEIIKRIQQIGTPFALRLCESFEKRGKSRLKVLREHQITDIMCLPKLSNVLAGQEPIPGTQSIPDGTLYYTPAEYQAHLKQILWHLDVFPHYQAIITDDPLNDNITLYIKGNHRVLLVKRSAPFAVFDVTEQSMASAFCDYLRRIAEEKMTVGARHHTIDRLQEELRRIEAAV